MLIDALRGRPVADRIRSLARGGEPPVICAINVAELWRGARSNEEQAVSSLLGGFRVAPLGEREGRLAGTWRREFAARGITLDQSDCLIAAAAVTSSARLATGNPGDFPMPELEVEHWPVGA